jgi:hypothetical protein
MSMKSDEWRRMKWAGDMASRGGGGDIYRNFAWVDVKE